MPTFPVVASPSPFRVLAFLLLTCLKAVMAHFSGRASPFLFRDVAFLLITRLEAVRPSFRCGIALPFPGCGISINDITQRSQGPPFR